MVTLCIYNIEAWVPTTPNNPYWLGLTTKNQHLGMVTFHVFTFRRPYRPPSFIFTHSDLPKLNKSHWQRIAIVPTISPKVPKIHHFRLKHGGVPVTNKLSTFIIFIIFLCIFYSLIISKKNLISISTCSQYLSNIPWYHSSLP